MKNIESQTSFFNRINFLHSLKITSMVVVLLCMITTSNAQVKKLQNNPTYDNKWLHLGFTLGLNSMNYRLELSESFLNSDSIYGIEVESHAGFQLGVVSNLRLNDHLSLRLLPGMVFGERTLKYSVRRFEGSQLDYIFDEYTMNMPSIYIDIPLILKFKGARINNFRPYLIGGFSIKYDLETIRTEDENDGYTIKVEPFDYFWEVGIGIDFYLVYFKLSTELKLCNSIRNTIIHENIDYSTSIDKLKAQLFVFSLHFE